MNWGTQNAIREFGRGQRGDLVDWNAHSPTEIHTKYHTGQYRFCITFSIGRVSGRGSENTTMNNTRTAALSAHVPKGGALGNDVLNGFLLDQMYSICSRVSDEGQRSNRREGSPHPIR